MATDDADAAPRQLEGEVTEGGRAPAVVGEYTWEDFLRERGLDDEADALYERLEAAPGSDRWGDDVERTLTPADWERAGVDPTEFLGFPPWELDERIGSAHHVAQQLADWSPLLAYDETPVVKDIYGWEDYRREYNLDAEEFDRAEALGFDPGALDSVMADHDRAATELAELVDERTVNVAEDFDEDAFFTTKDGRSTVVNRYDLEKTVPLAKKGHFREIERYWVNEPYAFVVIFHSTKENEKKYYVVQPHLNDIESDLKEYLTDKLRTSIKYAEEGTSARDEDHRRKVIEDHTYELLDRYDLYEPGEDEDDDGEPLGNRVADLLGIDPDDGVMGSLVRLLGYEEPTIRGPRQLEGISARPEPAILQEDANTLNEYQIQKLLYYLERDFIGYERIDGIKHDINVEDISCDGYNRPVFVAHSEYEQIISNIYHGKEELDDFVVKLAQRSGKGISKRRPQVDATLSDGSRAQLTLGREVSDHGTNYTIRQFQEIPNTPIDLINWYTFSLDEMAYLWLCIENNKSLIFAGGTASGKTTSLNAVSLFIPSNSKIVSIEDTREVELPQRNWIASVTRPSFSDDEKGDVDEFDLLEAALRQRPDYIVMGEVRGEEGRTLFQVMSTGHTSYTTFHADNVGEVLKRFTTDPINVSKTMFTALDLVSVQTQTRVRGSKVRRNKSLTEINHYDAENDEINVQDVFQWQAETDEFLKMGESNTLEEIKFDRGWDQERIDSEMFKRRVVLAYLIYNGLNTYTQVAATLQAFINDPETILALMANERLENSLEDLREMESVLIDIDPEKEEMVPRPDPDEAILAECEAILERAQEELFEQYQGERPASVADALGDIEPEPDVTPADAAGELPPGVEEVLAESKRDREVLEQLEQGELPEGLEAADLPPELRGHVEGDEEVPALAEGDADASAAAGGESAGAGGAGAGDAGEAGAGAAGAAGTSDSSGAAAGASGDGTAASGDGTASSADGAGAAGDGAAAGSGETGVGQSGGGADVDWDAIARELDRSGASASEATGGSAGVEAGAGPDAGTADADDPIDIDNWGFGEVQPPGEDDESEES